MKKQHIKFSSIVFIVLVLILNVSITAYAHAGKTDEYGGHFDGSTGEYHYHHGYPAHQHENGICPYDYDDNTDHSSGGHSSGSTNSEYTTVEHQSTTEHNEYPHSQDNSSNKEYYIANTTNRFIILSVFIVLFDLIVFTVVWKKEFCDNDGWADFFEYLKMIFIAYFILAMLSFPVVLILGLIGAIDDIRLIFGFDTDIFIFLVPFYTGFIFIVIMGIRKLFQLMKSK